MTEATGPDHVLTEEEREHYQAMADRAGTVVTVTDSRPSTFYPHQEQRAAEKEAGH